MVVFDTNFLSLLLHPGSRPPLDPATDKPLERTRDRIEQLRSTLQDQREKIGIPAPALSEFLILADEAGPDYIQKIDGSSAFKVLPFDQRAAIELAALDLQDRRSGDKRGGSTEPWQKIKLDRQIVAIAKPRCNRVLRRCRREGLMHRNRHAGCVHLGIAAAVRDTDAYGL